MSLYSTFSLSHSFPYLHPLTSCIFFLSFIKVDPSTSPNTLCSWFQNFYPMSLRWGLTIRFDVSKKRRDLPYPSTILQTRSQVVLVLTQALSQLHCRHTSYHCFPLWRPSVWCTGLVDSPTRGGWLYLFLNNWLTVCPTNCVTEVWYLVVVVSWGGSGSCVLPSRRTFIRSRDSDFTNLSRWYDVNIYLFSVFDPLSKGWFLWSFLPLVIVFLVGGHSPCIGVKKKEKRT